MTDRCTCYDTLVVKDLNRWFKEKWVDVSRKDKDGKHPPCGRSKAKTSSKGYPKCRPSVKVSDKTPKTSGQMTSGEKQAATKRKRAKKQGVGGKPTIVKEAYPENQAEYPPSLVSVSNMLGTDAPQTCTVPGCNNPVSPVIQARYANPLRSIDYTHYMCPEHADMYDFQSMYRRSEPMDLAWRLLKRDLSEMTDYDIDRARFSNDNPKLQNEERMRAMDRMTEYARQNVTPFDYGREVEEAYDEISDQDHADYFGEDIDPNELYRYILENAGEEAAQNYVQQYKDARAKYGGNAATMGQLDNYAMSNPNDVNDFIESRERMTGDMRSIMPDDETVFDAFPYPEGVAYNNKLSPPFTTTPQNEHNFQMKYAGEPMDIAMRLLKTPVSPEAKRHKIEYDKKYESNPERVKYREELNAERRKRGIYGHGGPDMSHTKRHTLVAESPHANRARHFKNRGTLK